MTKQRQWTTRTVFYTNIVVKRSLKHSARAVSLKSSNLQLDNSNENRVGYAIYGKGPCYLLPAPCSSTNTGLPSKILTSDKVKADSASVKYNITWGRLNHGSSSTPPDLLSGNVSIQNHSSATRTAGICNIPRPSSKRPFLVFLSDEALTNSGGVAGDNATTYASGKVHATIGLAALTTQQWSERKLAVERYVQGRSGETVGAEQGVRTAGGACAGLVERCDDGFRRCW
ncbi:hypothetical protein FRC04_002485 [Tulasnella sp. 424]|nr:hypothetical protein FRC04_002485 [Tulasnella sp. 424]KAG8967068.1 hypothetical protein FRC05_002282 [Tulasnella sp. 425]